MGDWPDLPVAETFPQLGKALSTENRAVLVAPPGAGKTTLVPLWMLGQDWLGQHQRIILIEPRRLAARTAAHRMAELNGDGVGQTVGYRMRLDTRVSNQTRIEVVTEGVFQRMVADDPELSGIGAVIFDEFHERSLDADFGLALALDVQAGLREELRLLVMSATLDTAGVANILGDAPVIESKGRQYPVEHRYWPRVADETITDAVISAVRRCVAQEGGSILVFLPGQGEIRRVADRLQDQLPKDVFLAPLYGAMSLVDQTRAIKPAASGERKIVLATAIAQTSITIDGVRIVIDSGLSRQPHYELAHDVTRLNTVPVSRASADQRAGRAGRTEPGIAIRLWPEAKNAALPAHDPPEILNSDLSHLLLNCLALGIYDPSTLTFIDQPPGPALERASQRLQQLSAIDANRRITDKGELMRTTGLPVRQAAMVVEGSGTNGLEARARLALLLGERGLGGGGIDLQTRLELLAEDKGNRAKSIRNMAKSMARRVAGDQPDRAETETAGEMLADAYADRIAKARAGQPGVFQMANGRAAAMDETEPLAACPYIVVADLTGRAECARILAAAEIGERAIVERCADRIVERETLTFDTARKRLTARIERRLDALVLSQSHREVKAGPDTVAALLAALKKHGLGLLPWNHQITQLRDRMAWLHDTLGAPWPDCSDDALIADIEDWLAPYLHGLISFDQLSADNLKSALLGRVDYQLQRKIDELAPTHFTVPTGSRVPLQYDTQQKAVVVSVRVQELFGTSDHPTIADGKVPLLLELMSPAHRPIQRTTDLPKFWSGSWADVRADMRGRYPKHVWPEDPANASPTKRAKPRK